MIIKAKPLYPWVFKLASALVGFALRRILHKVVIKPIEIKPDHSYILMCNHFSFTDGYYAVDICNKVLLGKNKMRRLYAMSVKKQMEKRPFLKYFGSFSIEPRKRSMRESFEYAAEILSQPGNLLLYYPQGNLESSHVTYIHFEDGINQIIPLIKGKCQIIWSSNIVEIFESLIPTLQYHMLDCGTNQDFDFEELKAKVNAHHLACLNSNVRFTEKPIR